MNIFVLGKVSSIGMIDHGSYGRGFNVYYCFGFFGFKADFIFLKSFDF